MNREGEKISVAILARNEQDSIGRVIEGVQPVADEVLVIDGNSTDSTVEAAESAGAKVYADQGRGKGDGIRKAIEVAGGDVIVFMDADGSHEPGDIPRMVAPIIAGEADLVVGSRWTGGSDELGGDVGMFIRSTGSSFITLVINYRWDVRLTDVENGFRAIARDVARSIDLVEHGFTIEQEMVMKCLKGGYKVTEVPTHEYRRQAGSSDLAVWRVLHKFAWNLVKNLVR